MPFVEPDAQDSRKRGWSDDEWDTSSIFCTPTEQHSDIYFKPHTAIPVRKIQPFSKRARTANGSIGEVRNISTPLAHKRQTLQQLSRYQQSQQICHEISPLQRTTTDLTPCHICHRRPTKKSHLDAFAQCQGCGEQTCFVCLRECMGWNPDDGSVLCEQEVLSRSFHMTDVDDNVNDPATVNIYEDASGTMQSGPATQRQGWDAGGHRGVVCSRCCIERGADGEIVCLGCLPRLEGA